MGGGPRRLPAPGRAVRGGQEEEERAPNVRSENKQEDEEASKHQEQFVSPRTTALIIRLLPTTKCGCHDPQHDHDHHYYYGRCC